ncbi:helix-turn-helix domain-containing protein [Variovorax sp. J31P207]|uniref:GlxA family transcriptional regulator n=1 Tax=Variovorax sp. J31P207 TaxID=3053510 RepID=UPI00257899CD|nr:helix-turn-helix domain-containing protein [Variovorax sp. J31P207]MDM0071621.1 helix-turn-helix domain-containing protein [Variovorax sp. J31P207]
MLVEAGPTRPIRRVVFVAVAPIVEIDLVGPLHVFQAANETSQENGEGPTYDICVVSTEAKGRIHGACGLEIVVGGGHYGSLRASIDTLVIVTGKSVFDFSDPELCEWLNQAARRTRRIASIGLGSFVLAAAGLLDQQKVAAHWTVARQLSERYPAIDVDAERVWAKSGSIYTSAGVTAGIDLAMALVEEDVGSRVALHIARMMVVFLKRPGGQLQFSIALKAQMPSTRSFADLAAWVAENLDKPLSVETLAEQMAMSSRNFSRVFREETGVTPARYVRQARLDAARVMLEQTRRGLEQVASLCGFGSDEVMRRAFVEDLGVSPAQYRATFATGPLEQR